MKQNCKKRLARFLKDLEAEHDTFDITILTLTALVNSLDKTPDCPSKEFKRVCRDLILMIRQARPDAVPLNHLLEYLELDLSGILNPETGALTLKERVIAMLNQRICQVERHRDALTEKGLAYVGDGDCILVHGADGSLISTLVRAGRERQLDFRVVIADFDPGKTCRLASALREAGVAFEQVCPGEINGCTDRVTKLFLGAMSVTRDKKILAPSGTGELVRRCRQAGIPLYFFADTLHYTFGRAGDQPIFTSSAGGDDAELGASARDLVPLSLVEHLVTEIGEVTKDGLLLSEPDHTAAAEKIPA